MAEQVLTVADLKKLIDEDAGSATVSVLIRTGHSLYPDEKWLTASSALNADGTLVIVCQVDAAESRPQG
jgi:hypothetical protein